MKNLLLTAFSICLLHVSFAQTCEEVGCTVRFWDDTKGSAESYISHAIVNHHYQGLLVVLGEDADGVYVVEGGIGSDAGDYWVAKLVHLRTDGSRREFLVSGTEEDYELIENGRYRNQAALIRSRVRRLIRKGHFTPSALKHVSSSSTSHDKDHAQVSITPTDARKSLAWQYTVEPEMCWCHFAWISTVSDL